jgi:ABC-2 type transport system ATP-binding protein
LDEFLLQPVRKLSLGQRMRAEIANSLFAKPEVIFLDEPTIGLDVVAKRALRETIVEANRAGTTIFLTSHDVGDIEAIAGRTIVVNHGRIMLDTTTDNLNAQYLYTKKVRVLAKHKIATTLRILDQAPQEVDGRWATFSVDTKESDLKSFIEALMQAIDIADLTVADTPLENIIHDIYTRESA